MCDRLAECAGLLEPVVMAVTRRILSSQVIGTDDTPVAVQDQGAEGSKTGRLRAYLGDRDNPFVGYDYSQADGPVASG